VFCQQVFGRDGVVNTMLETHPFGNFVPKNAKYLLLGSFTGKSGDPAYDWFYCSKRNQFWSILENVYDRKLPSKKDKQGLFTKLGMAMADIIYQCERKKGNNLDSNLINIIYNIEAIEKMLQENNIEKIFFSSRFVENKFRRLFKAVKPELITLPSPSPRYAQMTLKQKVARYKEVLPSF
jgi:hypoxanthine-DNA glycosylase